MAAAGTLQKVIRVLRETGVPLGMSVAGGIGSNPYGKGNEVGTHVQADNVFNSNAKWLFLSAGCVLLSLYFTYRLLKTNIGPVKFVKNFSHRTCMLQIVAAFD